MPPAAKRRAETNLRRRKPKRQATAIERWLHLSSEGRLRLPQQLLERSPPPVWRDMRPCAHTALQDAEGDVAVSDLNDLAVAREEGEDWGSGSGRRFGHG